MKVKSLASYSKNWMPRANLPTSTVVMDTSLYKIPGEETMSGHSGTLPPTLNAGRAT